MPPKLTRIRFFSRSTPVIRQYFPEELIGVASTG
jgi:hypothetical protein